MNIKNFLKKESKLYDIIIYFIEFITAVLMGISIYKLTYKYKSFEYISKLDLSLIIIAGIIVISCIVLNIIRNKKTIEKLFVAFVIPVGVMFTILLPMNWAPDEMGHMFKTYDISKGNLITPLGEKNEGEIFVPKEMLNLATEFTKLDYSKIHEHMQVEPNYKDLVSVDTIAKTYFPINYVTGAIIFAICRLLNLNILLACYLVRLVNFILFVLVGYISIKTVPFGKLLMAIYMFLPMIIQQAASLSADAFVNAASLFFIAYSLKLAYQDYDIKIKQKVIYYLLIISIAACKYVYFPLALISLLFIKNKNISKRNKIELIIIPLVLSIIIAGAWFMFSQKYVDIRPYIKEVNIKPIEQIKFILTHPISFCKVLKHTFEEYGSLYLLTFAGQQLGALNIMIPEIYVLIELGLLLLIPFFEKNDIALSKISKWIIIAISVILCLLVLVGLYVTWSQLEGDLISGVQGRYFIPIFILVLLAFIKKGQNIDIKNVEIKYFTAFFLLNIVSVLKVYGYFLYK